METKRLLQIETAENMEAQKGLRRELTLGSATALVVGEVIAVGIFLTPAQMAKSLGSPLLVIIVWLAMGGMALSGAFCYGELASRYPRTGGGYVYLREAYGPRLGFLYGWKCFLVMDPGLTAALAVGTASYVGYIVHLSAQIIAYFIFVTVIFIGLTVAALFVLRRREKDSTYNAPGYPVTPILFLSLVVLMLV